MATLTAARIAITGTTVTLAAAAGGGDKAKPGPGVFLYVTNGDSGPHTVTLNDPNSVDPGNANDFDPDVDIVIVAGVSKFIPLPVRFLDADGLAHWTYDAVTSVTVGAFILPLGRGLALPVTGTVIATQKLAQAGLAPSYTAAAASQKIKPGPRTFLHVRNAHNADHTITLDDPTSVTPVGASAFNPDVAVSVVQATSKFIGPVDDRFADRADTGRADIAWSATTSMSVASLQI